MTASIQKTRTAVLSSTLTPATSRAASAPATLPSARDASTFTRRAASPTVLAQADRAPRPAALPSITPGGAEEASDLGSTAAQRAMASSLAFFTGHAGALASKDAGLVAHNVERDELDRDHVRLDRTQDGLPISMASR